MRKKLQQLEDLAREAEHGGWGRVGATRIDGIDGKDGRGLSAWRASGWPWQT